MIAPETAEAVIDHLRAIVRSSRANTARRAHQSDSGFLPPHLAALLGHVHTLENHRSCDLAESLRITQSALSRQVTQAISIGYIERVPDPADGRAALLSLTAHGAEALRRHRHEQGEFLRVALADWDEADGRTFVDHLARVAAAVDMTDDALAAF
ncbi:winged helix-turn-helix transcriptional regulator [Rhodococcus sp. D2-41]|uniref:MarR family winged helix-turn-helix transcriptional regulator n=1 Tax=Speluncibacter jeojiensis TaxID=2710754 RepID=UPI00240F614A|nr:MarR family winged helix-turn-helix transcriptional regulator [Rhodococcus sp. D2-41]MDG3009587.1 winged helix-turn-helix transcriptional regulator [Rhodococcus sp. D2-41]